MVWNALLFAVAPTLAIPAGAALIAWRPPGHTLRSILLHFAAGGLVAVIGVELLGEFDQRSPWPVAVGGLAGTGFMAALETITRRLEQRSGGRGGVGVLAVLAVDFFIDGLLLGVALHHDHSFGLVLAVALTLEDLVTAVSVSSTLVGTMSDRHMVATVSLVGTGFPLGAMTGGLLGGLITGGLYAAVLAFAAVALLFLALEELLKEAHETEEHPLVTSTLFVGLFAFLMLELAIH